MPLKFDSTSLWAAHDKVSLACQEDSLRDCLIANSYLSSHLVRCRDRRRDKATSAAMQGWAGRLHSSRRSPLNWTLKSGCPPQAKQDRRLFETVPRKPSCIAILWIARRTQPVLLPRKGTSGLLAILQLAVCRAGCVDSRWHTRLLRREIRCSLGARNSSSCSCARAQFRRTSPENFIGRRKVEVTFKR